MKKYNFFKLLILAFITFSSVTYGQVFEELNGIVAVEAEHYILQEKDDIRKWYKITAGNDPSELTDADGNHAHNASGGTYLECLPDTRRNHDEKLIKGENFSNEPGKMAILHYKVFINNPGKYYVWVRTHTSNTEDNGIHVGIDGEWPETGQRMQFDGNKKAWSWESRQRTEEVHTGVPELIYLDIDQPGEHTILFSMREDGFEFDKWVLSKKYDQPEGLGPSEKIYKK